MAGERARTEALPGGPGMATALAALTALVSLSLVDRFDWPLGLVPHLAPAPMFFWVSRGQSGTGPLGAFLVGLLVDVMTASPLGLTAALYLAFHGLARRRAPILADLALAGRVVAFALLAGAVTGLHGLALYALAGIAPGRTETAVAVAATLLAYPLIELLAGPERWHGRRAIKGLGR